MKPLPFQKIFALFDACHDLIEIVEGVSCSRWANEKNQRLKDTKEWCRLYVVVKDIEKIAERVAKDLRPTDGWIAATPRRKARTKK